jgi:two-component system chemotaxis response regulator CheY
MGHRPRVAATGAEALALHADRRANVIVCDRRLVDVDGLELCRRVRDADTGAYTVLLLAGAIESKHELLAAVRAGADDFLRKPVDADELEARLIAASRGLQAYRAIAAQNVDLRRDSQALFRTARVDPLTHVANRLRLDEDLESLEAQVTRYGRRVSIAMCDLDSFKLYNDRYGHLAGDEALRRIARTLRANVRRGDHVYRYGGEEFLVVLAEQGPEEAAAAMDRVRAAVEELGITHAAGAKHSTLTVSVGVAAIGAQNGDSSVLDAIRAADRALYRVKARGGNGLAVEPDRSAA